MTAPESVVPGQIYHRAWEVAGGGHERNVLRTKLAASVLGTLASAGLFVSCYSDVVDSNEAVAAAVASYDQNRPPEAFEAAQYEMYVQLIDGRVEHAHQDPEEAGTYLGTTPIVGNTEEDPADVAEALINMDDDRLEELRAAHEVFTEWQQAKNDAADGARGSLWERYWKGGAGAVLSALSLLSLMSGTSYASGRRRKRVSALAWAASDLLDYAHEEQPSDEELMDFFSKVQMLPPIGSKIIRFEGGREKTIAPMNPVYAAESMVNRIIRNTGERKDAFVHHFTVQGRLPDRFKYAGIALLLNNPHGHDWDKPFYNAPWGKAGPMVHDGGKTKTDINENWRNTYGRTDFVQRMHVTGDDEIADMEENLRMHDEARFYQRAALALHCAEGTAPDSIPSEVRGRLANVWNDFEKLMQIMLNNLNLEKVIDTPWFIEKPRAISGWPGLRYEADLSSMIEALKSIEQERSSRGIRVSDTMKEVANRVDIIIGLMEEDQSG